MATKESYPYQRYLCPVSGFFNALDDGRKEVIHHEAQQQIDFRCDRFEASSYYYFLSDEIILSYQHILPYQPLQTKLQVHNGKKFFLFEFFQPGSPSLRLNVNQEALTLAPQSFIFAHSNSDFEIVEQPGIRRSYFQIVVTEKFIREYIAADLLTASQLSDIITFSGKKSLMAENDPKILPPDFKELMYFFSTGHANEFSKIRNFRIITSFLTGFFKAHHIPLPSKGQPTAKPPTSKKEALLKKYLDEHIDRPFIGSAEMAKRFHMSSATLNRHFVRAFNLTPFEYFRKAQMEYAKKLLLETDLSVSEIAYKLGFHTPANFIRSFKNVAGLTPGTYKTQFSDK